MDREKLLRLEIEETDPDAIEDALEEKQNDLETRMDTAESNGNIERKKQLELELAEVEELLKQVKEEKKAALSRQKEQPQEEKKARGVVPTAVEETVSHTVPTAIDGLEELADNVAGKLETVKNVFGGKNRGQTKDAKEKAEEKAREAEDKRHEAELKAKAAKLRKKAAEEEAVKAKAEKEAAKAKAEKEADKAKTEKEADKTEEKETDKTGGEATSKADLSEYEKLLNEGIAAYATGKHSEAFQKIYKVANVGKNSKLSRDKLGQAEQLLARMYKNGEGTVADTDRAWFWFEKAANHENIEGCLAMGQRNAELTPKSPEEENTYRVNALKYFKIAGNNGNKVGKEKFIDICIKKKSQITFGDIRTAGKFFDDLIELESDSFVKQSLLEKKQDFFDRTSEKKAKKKKRNNHSLYYNFRDLLSIIGALLTVFGVMLYCNCMLEYYDTFFNFDKLIPEYFKVNMPPTNWLLDLLREYDMLENLSGSNTGRWSMLFIPIGFMISAMSRIEYRGAIANVICEIALYFSVIAGFVAFYYVCPAPYVVGDMYGLLTSGRILVLIQIFRLPGILIRYFIDRR